VEDPLAELMVAQDTVPSGKVFFDAGPDGLIPSFTEVEAGASLSPAP